ncbi:MAG: ABC transporter permease, partial [Rheinheimera sp.]
MILNYLITAFRAFARHKLHFVLNISGLCIGMAAAILVALYASHEASYDSQQPNAERVVRVEQFFIEMGMGIPLTNKNVLNRLRTLEGVEDLLVLEHIPTAEEYRHQEQFYKLSGVFGASPNIQDFIQLEVVQGDLNHVLNTPQQMALSASYAQMLFGKSDAIGQTLQQADQVWTIGAVFADLPENTHFAFNALRPMNAFSEFYRNNDSYNYLRLSQAGLENKLQPQLEKAYTDLAYPGMTGKVIDLTLSPLTEIHLNGGVRHELKMTGSRSAIYICVGLSVLLIAL